MLKVLSFKCATLVKKLSYENYSCVWYFFFAHIATKNNILINIILLLSYIFVDIFFFCFYINFLSTQNKYMVVQKLIVIQHGSGNVK